MRVPKLLIYLDRELMTNFTVPYDIDALVKRVGLSYQQAGIFTESLPNKHMDFDEDDQDYTLAQLTTFAVNNDYLWRGMSASEIKKNVTQITPDINRTKKHWEYCASLNVGIELIAVVPRVDAWLIYRFVDFDLEERVASEGYVREPENLAYSCVYLSDVHKKNLPYCFAPELRDKSLDRYIYGRNLLCVPRLLENRLKNQQEYWAGQDAKNYETEYLKLLK